MYLSNKIEEVQEAVNSGKLKVDWVVILSNNELNLTIKGLDNNPDLTDDENMQLDRLHRNLFGIRRRLQTGQRVGQPRLTTAESDNLDATAIADAGEYHECKDCCNPFFFSEAEKEYYISKQLDFPLRCKECRDYRRAERAP